LFGGGVFFLLLRELLLRAATRLLLLLLLLLLLSDRTESVSTKRRLAAALFCSGAGLLSIKHVLSTKERKKREKERKKGFSLTFFFSLLHVASIRTESSLGEEDKEYWVKQRSEVRGGSPAAANLLSRHRRGAAEARVPHLCCMLCRSGCSTAPAHLEGSR